VKGGCSGLALTGKTKTERQRDKGGRRKVGGTTAGTEDCFLRDFGKESRTVRSRIKFKNGMAAKYFSGGSWSRKPGVELVGGVRRQRQKCQDSIVSERRCKKGKPSEWIKTWVVEGEI